VRPILGATYSGVRPILGGFVAEKRTQTPTRLSGFEIGCDLFWVGATYSGCDLFWVRPILGATYSGCDLFWGATYSGVPRIS